LQQARARGVGPAGAQRALPGEAGAAAGGGDAAPVRGDLRPAGGHPPGRAVLRLGQLEDGLAGDRDPLRPRALHPDLPPGVCQLHQRHAQPRAQGAAVPKGPRRLPLAHAAALDHVPAAGATGPGPDPRVCEPVAGRDLAEPGGGQGALGEELGPPGLFGAVRGLPAHADPGARGAARQGRPGGSGDAGNGGGAGPSGGAGHGVYQEHGGHPFHHHRPRGSPALRARARAQDRLRRRPHRLRRPARPGPPLGASRVRGARFAGAPVRAGLSGARRRVGRAVALPTGPGARRGVRHGASDAEAGLARRLGQGHGAPAGA
ncbi:hypothetical protein H632_c4136p0, partial [Helicosporidium sp. ATCC 50920]